MVIQSSSLQTIIRPYQPADLEAIVRLWYDTWHETFPHLQHPHPYAAWKNRFHQELAARASIWVAEWDDLVVGFMAAITAEGYLDQLFVDRRYHNRGIGKALLERAKLLCPDGLTLYTLRENEQARAFYERNGFVAGRLSVNAFNGQPNVEYRWKP